MADNVIVSPGLAGFGEPVGATVGRPLAGSAITTVSATSLAP